MFDELDALENSRPQPPATLYKYVHPSLAEKIFGEGFIRFTPPLNTNDIFEVRQAFDLMAGPKLQAMFTQQLIETDIDDMLVVEASKAGINLPASTLKALAGSLLGTDLDLLMQSMVTNVLDNHLYPKMNSQSEIDRLLENLGRNLLCLSLTEKMDSSPMWAHYADNSNGFVIALDTDRPFFKRGDDESRQGLHKITYFDGRMSEIMDNPYAAFISKQADWAYEREWRLYTKLEDAKRIIPTDDGGIHLIEFPSEIVNRVILGMRASAELESELKSLLADRYPNVQLSKVVPDRATATLSEVPV